MDILQEKAAADAVGSWAGAAGGTADIRSVRPEGDGVAVVAHIVIPLDSDALDPSVLLDEVSSQGERAAIAGESVRDCRHAEGSAERASWNSGYDIGAAETLRLLAEAGPLNGAPSALTAGVRNGHQAFLRTIPLSAAAPDEFAAPEDAEESVRGWRLGWRLGEWQQVRAAEAAAEAGGQLGADIRAAQAAA